VSGSSSGSADFPALNRNRVFLEFRLDDGLVFEGYGPGYDKGSLPGLLASGEHFAAGDRVARALATDPFAVNG
jgi:hypothetical protein